jgi:hypothetical protein
MVRIHDDLVRNGLSAWASAQDNHERIVAAYRSTLGGTDNAAIFGDDDTGRQFLSSYLQGGGPDVLLFGANGLGGILEALGTTGEQLSSGLDAAISQEDANRAVVARSANPPSSRA